MDRARRHAWAQAGGLPPVQVADKKLEGVTCIRLDATVVTAHSGKELAEPSFKGFGHHPVRRGCHGETLVGNACEAAPPRIEVR